MYIKPSKVTKIEISISKKTAATMDGGIGFGGNMLPL